ncbi:UNVERIFIED_CONTAM: hypothetical protein PYX00_010549 [Menopon gallinae]|uniref:Gamma-interferon-inducible lysosomal thiol reductase n=1 Tax=Menopon gallinae TaxID=328185 RepID=A0AAW2HGE5_9NEOP
MKYLFLIAALISAASQIDAAVVNVTLYYESLCIDCVEFIKYQMWPTYQSLGDHLKLDFVPFGKASWTENPWSIRCQNGDRECHGNAIQACALERYKKPEMQVKFVSCVMTERQPDKAGKTCADRLGYSYEGIEECALGQEGRQLHMKHGKRTKGFRPVITFIPTIAFNDVYNSKDQQMSMYQFKYLVCSKFPPGEKPPGCRNVVDAPDAE